MHVERQASASCNLVAAQRGGFTDQRNRREVLELNLLLHGFSTTWRPAPQISRMTIPNHGFSDCERRGLYRAIRERRDVRSQFLPDRIPHDLLGRLLQAAHHAPSVGFMQPWDFIVIEDIEIKQAVKSLFDDENAKAAANYSGEQADLYSRLKLEGILDSPINLCITCDRARGGPHVLGRNTVLETDLFSVSLAVQNLWLAARVEGIGVGWVSILDQRRLADLLKLPPEVYAVAYLCVGYVSEFLVQPELEMKGWRSRLQLSDLVHRNVWGQRPDDAALLTALGGATPTVAD